MHGLNGNAFTTWAAQPGGFFWPKELLPQLIPIARIMTFGYNANVLNDSIEGRIAEFAENLLAELSAERYHPTVQQHPDPTGIFP